MANKVRYGLSHTKYALWDETTQTYGSVKDFPGAVSLSLSREGGDSSDFYADDGIYFTFAGTNGGYSADFEVAMVTDEIRQDLLGEVADDGTGIQFEVTDAIAPQFALITEMQGSESPIGFVFYACKASRIETAANTRNDSPEVDTETFSLRISAQEFTFKGEKKNFVQGHIAKSSTNTTQYAAFFESVVLPTASED